MTFISFSIHCAIKWGNKPSCNCNRYIAEKQSIPKNIRMNLVYKYEWMIYVNGIIYVRKRKRLSTNLPRLLNVNTTYSWIFFRYILVLNEKYKDLLGQFRVKIFMLSHVLVSLLVDPTYLYSNGIQLWVWLCMNLPNLLRLLWKN